MDAISVPFATRYDAVADTDLLKQLEDNTAGVAIVIGSMSASVDVRGLVRLEGDQMVVDYREKATMVAGSEVTELAAQVRTLRIPLSAIDSIRIKRTLMMRPRIIVELNRMDVLPPLRWSDGTRIVLPIAWRDRTRGRELTVSTMNRMADQALARLNDG